jgi:hypothetical protein
MSRAINVNTPIARTLVQRLVHGLILLRVFLVFEILGRKYAKF